MTKKNKLPKDWEIKKLGEVCKITYGKGLSTKKLKDKGYQVFGANGIIGFNDSYLYEHSQVLISCRGAYSGKINYSPPLCYVTNNSLILEIHNEEKINKRFLFYILHTVNKTKLVTGTAQPQVTINNAIELTFSIPDIETQQVIVSKIEELFSELDKGIEDLKTAQQQLKTYRQSVLKYAFEGKLTNEKVKEGVLPKKWKWVKLKEVAKDISDGDHQAPPKSTTGIPFITISNVNKLNNQIDFTNTFKVNTDYYLELKQNRKPQKGDVLYTVTGSFGIPILIDYEKDFCFQRHIGLVRPLDTISQKWIFYLLQSPQIFSQAKETATGTAQKTVALGSLRNFDIPHCHYDEQIIIVQEIESRLSVADKMEESIAQSLQQAEALRQSILKKAFSGELV